MLYFTGKLNYTEDKLLCSKNKTKKNLDPLVLSGWCARLLSLADLQIHTANWMVSKRTPKNSRLQWLWSLFDMQHKFMDVSWNNVVFAYTFRPKLKTVVVPGNRNL